MKTKVKTINVTEEAHTNIRIYCACIKSPLGDFVELAVAEKIERDAHD